LFGVPKELPLTYELFLSFLEPQDREPTEQAVRRSVETGCSFDMQYRVSAQSQSNHWVRARGSVVKDEQGTPRHLSGIVIDIDEQKQIEEALRIREGHLRPVNNSHCLRCR
jgi:two-component system sensor kinase FixL